MTRNDDLKAICPYMIGKRCIANECPKWRWETPKRCAELNGRFFLHKCIDVNAWSENVDIDNDEEHPDIEFCVEYCPFREGYCS